MTTTIKIKNSVTPGSSPAGLSLGEMAINVTDKKLFSGNAVGSAITILDGNNLVTTFNGSTGAVTGVSSVNGFTGAVSITYAAAATVTSSNSSSTFYPVFAGGAGNTYIYIDDVTTPFTYVPSTGTLNIRNLNALNGNTGSFLSTSAVSVATNLDQTDLFSNSLYHEAFTSNSFTVSSTNSLKLSGSTIQFYGSGWGYTFPASNGSANQVLTTNGATPATLSWATPSSGITTGVANTFTALQTFSAGITSTTLYASAGVTFNSTSAHTGLATFSGGLTASGATFSGPIVSTGYKISSGAINAQTASYTLVAGDNGKIVTMNVATANNLTVPASLDVGFNTTVIQLGAGQTTIVASGTTLNSYQGYLKISGQHGSASIVGYTSNVYNVAGNLSA